MIAMLVIVILVLAVIRYNYPKRFVRLGQTIFRARLLRQLMREELVLSHRTSLALTIIFAANAALLVYLAAKNYGWVPYREFEFWFFPIVFGVIILLYLWKLIMVRLIQFFFSVDAGLSEYLVFSLVFNMLLGLVWLPFILVALVTLQQTVQIVLAVCLAMFLVGYVIRLGRGVLIAREQHIFSVYIILYLCALEILPFAVFAKGIAEVKF